MSNPIRTVMNMDHEIMTEAEAAELIGISPAALRQRRVRVTRGASPTTCPRWKRNGHGDIRYTRTDVEAWRAAAEDLRDDPACPTTGDAA